MQGPPERLPALIFLALVLRVRADQVFELLTEFISIESAAEQARIRPN
jgi:hypothetical protein